MIALDHLRTAFSAIGLITSCLGAMLIIGWLVDHAMRQWLRLTKSWELFIRFMWLDVKLKKQMQADMDYERKQRDYAFDTEPVSDEESSEWDTPPDLSVAPARTQPLEDDCHPLTRDVPLATKDNPIMAIMEAAAAAYDAQRLSAPPGSDPVILDSDDHSEAPREELSTHGALPAREGRDLAAEEIADMALLTVMEQLIVRGYLLPSNELRLKMIEELTRLMTEVTARTPRTWPAPAEPNPSPMVL